MRRRKLPNSGLAGRLTTLGLFRLMIMLLLTNMTRLVILWVKLTLRAMYITATFLPVKECTMPSILFISLGLRVEAGLLKSTTLGPTVRVWVTVMCRRRLFDSREGQQLA